MKKIIALLLAIMMVFALCACGSAPAAPANPAPAVSSAPAANTTEPDPSEKEVTLTVANFVAAGNPAESYLNWVFTEMYNRSGGTIKCEYYPGGTLLSQSNLYEGVVSGMADIGFLQIGDFPGQFPELQTAEVPGMYFTSAPAISYAVKDYIDTYNPAEVAEVKVLGINAGTMGCIAVNKGPIRSPEDIKGMTIRALGNMAKSVTAFGATPADISISDCYESLRTGVLDGIMTIRGALSGFMLCEVADYGFNYPFYNNVTMWFMNKDKFESLSDRQKEAVESSWKDLFTYFLSQSANDIVSDVPTLNAINSMKEFYWPTEDELELFRQKLILLLDEYEQNLNGKGMDGEEIRGRWEALAEKWNTEYPDIGPFEENRYCMHDPNTGLEFSAEGFEWNLPY